MSKGRYAKRFIVIISVTFFAGMFGLMAFNYTIDQTRVLHSDYDHLYYIKDRSLDLPNILERNVTFLRTKYYVEHTGDYNTFILGSSRSNAFDPETLPEGWVKMNFSGGTLSRYVASLRSLTENGVTMERSLIGFDSFVFYNDAFGENLRNIPYSSSVFDRMKAYGKLLLKMPHRYDLYVTTGLYTLRENDITTTHRAYIVPEERRQTDKHRQRTDEFRKRYHDLVMRQVFTRQQRELIDTALGRFKEIMTITDEHGINLTLYLNPLSYKEFLAGNYDHMRRYHRELALLHPFYSFLGLNRYTVDLSYFYDESHFYSPVADHMLAIITGERPALDSGFGDLITPSTVDDHFVRVMTAMHEHLPELLMRDHNIIVNDTFFEQDADTVNAAALINGAAPLPPAPSGQTRYLLLELATENGGTLRLTAGEGNLVENQAAYEKTFTPDTAFAHIPVGPETGTIRAVIDGDGTITSARLATLRAR